MRKTLLCLMVAVCSSAQTVPVQQTMVLTRIAGITSTWPGEGSGCPGTVINTSASSRQNTYHAVEAVGSGSWTVTIRFSNTSCTGPWSSYSSTASINQSSNPAIAFGIDPYNTPAKYVNITVTGNAVVRYAGQQQLPLSTATGSISFPITVAQGGTGATSFTPNGVVYSNTSGALVGTAAGAQYQTLQAGTSNIPLFDAVHLDQPAAVTGTLPVTNGGTGAATLTAHALLLGNGTGPAAMLAPGASGTFLKSNGPGVDPSYATVTTGGGGVSTSSDYDFTPQAPGGSLIAGGINQTINMAPCPLGVNGADPYHYVWLSGGTGTAEAVLITGGSCTSGALSGSITVTPASNHSGAWTVSSATNGLQEAIDALPTSGGIVNVKCGQTILRQTLSVGNGSGITLGTRNNISLRGCGKGRDASASAATELMWNGPTGGTVVRMQGPLFVGGLQDLRINANFTAAIDLDIYATSLAEFGPLAIVNGGTNSIAIRMDAGADFGATTQQNSFHDINIQATSSGASGLQLGPTNLNFNSGTFVNQFYNITVAYQNDTANSYCVYLGWADNNRFYGGGCQALTVPGSGCSLKHVRQPAGSGGWDFLPSENAMFDFVTGGNAPCGDSGRSVGTIYWPLQTLDSSGIPSTKNHLGFTTTGSLFDSSGRIGVMNSFRIVGPSQLATMLISGFVGNPATGTVQSTGTSLVGTGTLFTTEIGKGKVINFGPEYRWCDLVIDNTHCTLNAAFTDDLPAGSVIGYGLGSTMQLYSDGDAHIATRDHSKFSFATDGQDRGGMDADGFWYHLGKTFGQLTTFSPPNGRWAYCSDCVIASTCAGGGNGAIAKRLNNQWICN